MGLTLAAMLGQIGLPGGGFGFGDGSVQRVGAPVYVGLPALPQGRNRVDAFIPVARISDMLLHPGETFDYDGRRLTYPRIRMVYWCGGNPFHHHQDLGRLRRARARGHDRRARSVLDVDGASRGHRAPLDNDAGAQ